MRVDGTGAQEAPALSFKQDGPESAPLALGYSDQLLTGAGTTTTRRRGSSPSDTVDTPSISLSAS